MNRAEYVPLGRLAELHARQNAHLLAYTVAGWDAKVTTYKSRAALEAFCKDGSRHHAVMKAYTEPCMITNHNTQRVTRA